MAVIKKILVPCDFSVPAIAAFKSAINLAVAVNAEIEVLFAIDLLLMIDPVFGTQPMIIDQDFYTSLETEAQKEFQEMKNTLGNPNVTTSFKTQMASLLTVMLQEINLSNPDWIVMGTHGAAGWKEFFVGSNTEKIVRFASCPVFSVHESVDINRIKNIIVPTELKLNQTDFMVHLKALQRLTNATLNFLYVNAPDHSVSQRDLNDFTSHYKLTNYTITVRDNFDKTAEIIGFANAKNADLVAMATHSRKGLSHLISGSISEDVVNHIQSPVWTYSLNPK